MKYWVLRTVGPSDGAVIDALPEDSPSNWEYFEHKTLVDRFPSGATMTFSPNYPDARTVYDFVQNTLRLLIVSPKVQGLLDESGVSGVELLPVDLLDHQLNVAAEGFAIVNCLAAQDAIDLQRSDFTMGNVDASQISRLDELALDSEKIDPDLQLFSPTAKADLIVIRDDLNQALTAGGITGFRSFEADGWDGMDF